MTSVPNRYGEVIPKPKPKIAGAGKAPLTSRRSPNTGGAGYGSKVLPFAGGKAGTAGAAPLAKRRTPTTAKALLHSSPAAIAAATVAGTAQAKRVAAANAKAHPPTTKRATSKSAPKSTGHSIAQGHVGSGSHPAGAPTTSSPAPAPARDVASGGGIDLLKLVELVALGAAVFLLVMYLRKRR